MSARDVSDRPPTDLVLPTFLIVGFPRGGTTWLARALGEHPDVFMARDKELRFFNKRFDRGLGWYAAQFAPGEASVHRGEATPYYIYNRETMARVAATVPDALLLVCMRHPVDRAYSEWWMHRSLDGGERPLPGTLDGWREELGPLLRRSRYAEYLERLEQLFPRERVLPLIYEELVGKPDAGFAAVCGFLGVDPGVRPAALDQRINPHVGYRSSRLRRTTQRWPRILRAVVGRVNVVRGGYPPLPDDVHSRLAADMAPWNRRLAGWMGRSDPPWEPR